jgi:hypothetical protein
MAYMVIGLTFLAGSAYLGVETPLERFYFGMGVLCVAASLFIRHLRARNAPRPDESASAELNPD